MSRPPESSHTLKLRGTYRDDRHGERERMLAQFDGRPVCPAKLKGVERRYWKSAIEPLATAGIVRAIDTEMCVCACKAYASFVKAQDDAMKGPLTFNKSRMVATAGKLFFSFCSALGLTPLDRYKLRGLAKPNEATTPMGIAARKRYPANDPPPLKPSG